MIALRNSKDIRVTVLKERVVMELTSLSVVVGVTMNLNVPKLSGMSTYLNRGLEIEWLKRGCLTLTMLMQSSSSLSTVFWGRMDSSAA